MTDDADRQAVLDVIGAVQWGQAGWDAHRRAVLDALIAMPDKGPLLRALYGPRVRGVFMEPDPNNCYQCGRPVAEGDGERQGRAGMVHTKCMALAYGVEP